MEPMSPFAVMAQLEAEAKPRFGPGVMQVLWALAPFAHWGELDGLPKHIAGLFPEHERPEVLAHLTTAAATFRKATAPKE